ncbi:DNA polymerase-3 subunit epsilon [Crossiella equi]|uniref:DNA polymerase-3 subunit epsilon n=1 Tax=Crossiella equi TaxID=130796 RepID=A0ABS5AD18_9PSEU|nr:exonuclease domain-containing protein [Crossiella equi]MBP2474487.1 DNA polymerase-3 subunit epsilon [Crossiella equi]
MSGYAVVDVETTGLHPGYHHRVVEVAVVRLDERGDPVDEWCTLVNPDRDLGPQQVHGIRAAEVRRAPVFRDVAGELVSRLAGRVLVAHNVSFDARFLEAEYARLGVAVPFGGMPALCTMRLADEFLGSVSRSLEACCRTAGVVRGQAHSALADARAAAGLMSHYLRLCGTPEPWSGAIREAAAWSWPALPVTAVGEVRRGGDAPTERHFLANLVGLLPRVAQPVRADDYLDVLDHALLDRYLSAGEQEELVHTARGLGLGLPEVLALHRGYLDALAVAAWADGLVTDAEVTDLALVAGLLGLGGDDVAASFERARVASPGLRFRLEPGHGVVFTGQLTEPRGVWEERARARGLVVGAGVSRRTRLLVAADPDSLSGKAKKARDQGVPIVGEESFAALLAALG